MTIMPQTCFLLFLPAFLLMPAVSFACTSPNGCKPLLLAQQQPVAETADNNDTKHKTKVVLPDKAPSNPPDSAVQRAKPFYEVKTGDTLYSIGVKNGLSYDALARWNQLPPSYKILAGQKLKLFGPQQSAGAINKNPNSQPEKNKQPSADKTVSETKGRTEKAQALAKKSAVQKKPLIGKRDEGGHPLKTSPPSKGSVSVTDKNRPEKAAPLQTYGMLDKGRQTAEKAEKRPSPEKSPFQAAKRKTETANKTPKQHHDMQISKRKTGEGQKKATGSAGNKKRLKLNFKWPVKGVVASNFANTHHKGIDIACKEKKQPVGAAEAGTVAYQGEGLVGFKNLIIIKHNDEYLSAYANNSRMLVKEGQQVKQGQTIAEIGKASAKQKPLHFEIRKNGNPVDPLYFLPKQP